MGFVVARVGWSGVPQLPVKQDLGRAQPNLSDGWVSVQLMVNSFSTGPLVLLIDVSIVLVYPVWMVGLYSLLLFLNRIVEIVSNFQVFGMFSCVDICMKSLVFNL